ncbi:conjugal transfer protein TrbB [Mycolicibacter terrae]|uniref:conjugal transfer protein TrbB n=1 Tax=Mycolicibacter TaxID=1073531 RepID=UPI0016398DC5|nr:MULTISPECIES: conjugal transfer protein TrbB [Mycolicibacter]
MLLHVGRDRNGRRRLTDISLLCRTASGMVQAAPVWHAERGAGDHIAEFRALLRDRRPA